jgi:probable HAF family extracellular repeat protein
MNRMLAASALLAFLNLSPVYSQLYSLTDLGTLGGNASQATDINSSGTIVGLSKTSTSESTFDAFIYSGGV